MKKSIALILTVVIILASASSVFAELSSYVKSPTVQDVPDIIDFDVNPPQPSNPEEIPDSTSSVKDIEIVVGDGEDAPEIVITKKEENVVQFYTKDGDGPAVDDCMVTMKVTPYVERETIEKVVCKVTDGTSATGEVSAEDRLVYARTNEKNGADGLGADNFKLWREIIDDAAKKGLDGAADAEARIENKDLVIVTVFDVSVWCEKPAQHNLAQHHCVHTIRLSFGDDEMSSLLNNYVSLMHFNRAGEWEYIPSKLYEDPATGDDVVEFTIDCDNLSPFAIAAFSSESGTDVPTSPQTGEAFPFAYLACAAVCLGLSFVFLFKGRRKE